jgi:hypothetical protein
MWLSERLVPKDARAAWREDWLGDFWEWTLRATEAGAPDSKEALKAHTGRAIVAAFKAQFSTDNAKSTWVDRIGKPRLCLAAGAIPLVLVLILSEGLSDSRRLVRGLPYPSSSQVIGLVQGVPALGVRWGFAEKEVSVIRDQSKTLDSISTYQFFRAKFDAGQGAKEVSAAHVGPGFFRVFGVKPALGYDLTDAGLGSKPFVASYDFWKKNLGGDPSQIGRHFWVNGTPMRLAGVMPKGFWFLVGDTAIWTEHEQAPAPPNGRWWTRMRPTVARLHPGATIGTVEKELRKLEVDNAIARPNWAVFGTRTSSLVYGSILTYGESLLACFAAVLLWSAVQVFLERRRHHQWEPALRYWGFMVLKITAPLVAVFFGVCEFTGENTLNMAVRSWWDRIILNDWVVFCSVALLIFWAIRDQRARCRVCLERMRQPVRIGIPGQILLDAAGVEVMCPVGHGAVYTAESVLGSEMSNRWMGFEDVLR